MLISPNCSLSEINPKQPLQLGIMASGSGTNFEAIAKAIASGQLNAEIEVLIYNNPQAKVRSLGKKYNVPTILINHREYKTREDLDHAVVSTLQNYGVEWVVMAGWMRVVTEVLIASFPDRIINIHPSLLPSFKGIRAVEQALAAQVKITGCTVHLVSLEVDSGKILMQAAVPVLTEDTPATLHARIQEQEHIILPRAIALAALKGADAIENLTN
nr:phosphoribosylglycinamide formyltransferase [Myxosarcina sp. GI1]